jgi:hypothetical protein
MDLRNTTGIIRAAACLLILMLLVPIVSAAVDSDTIPRSTDPNAEDRPEALAMLKTHIAYLGESQDARMDGTIQYIDRISNETGAVTLKEIHDDYLVTASSVPLMQTAAEIAEARESLNTRARQFSDETKTRMMQFNGSSTAQRASVRESSNASAYARSINDTSVLSLSNESARLALFIRESNDRTLLLRSLGKQGINTTLAQNLSQQIDAQRSNLTAALTSHSSASLKITNAAIRDLTLEFRKNVADSRAALQIEMKRDAMMAIP